MGQSSTITIMLLLVQNCRSIRVEVITGKNSEPESKVSPLKLICMPALRKSDGKVLWEGLKSGVSERNQLASTFRDNSSVPDIRVNSNHIRCFLKAPDKTVKSEKKSRVDREVFGTVQAETGNCRPGYRIVQKNCFPCFPGSYASGQETECFLCPKDFYMSKEAADSCWPCPHGKKTLTEGADSEDACIYSNGVHVKTGLSRRWLIIIGIFLFIVLLISWILIFILWTRFCKFESSKTSQLNEVSVADSNGLPPRESQTKPKILSMDTPSERGKLKFSKKDRIWVLPFRKQNDVSFNIKGLATLTKRSSSTTSATDEDYTSNSKRNVKETCVEIVKEVPPKNRHRRKRLFKKKTLRLVAESNVQETLNSDSDEAVNATKTGCETHLDVRVNDRNHNSLQVTYSDTEKKKNGKDPSYPEDNENLKQHEKEGTEEDPNNIPENEIAPGNHTDDVISTNPGNSNGTTSKSIQNSEISGNEENSNDPVPANNFQHEIKIETIPTEPESTMEQKPDLNSDTYSRLLQDKQVLSKEKLNMQNDSLFWEGNSGLFSLKRDYSTDLHWKEESNTCPENSEIRITIEPNTAAGSKYTLPARKLSSSDQLLYSTQNQFVTTPTSCPIHQNNNSRCHVEVMLITLP